MVNTYLLLNVLADSLALLILAYILSKLAFEDKKFMKSKISQYYETMRRDKIFRKSLFILSFSIFFSIVSVAFSLNPDVNRKIVNSLQFLSSGLRIIFFLYILRAVKNA